MGTALDLRNRIRQGLFDGQTSSFCPGHVQVNVVILPSQNAGDFERFCKHNPKPCPVLEILPAGQWDVVDLCSESCDIRTDVPEYNIYRNGVLEETKTDIRDVWQGDFVTFLIGCSFTFEVALTEAGIPLRHQQLGCNVPMYITSQQTVPSGPFSGPLVVSMRPIHQSRIPDATHITGQFPGVHGAPVHIGTPSEIGIFDLGKPDYGDAVDVREGEVPVFWACGVTPQAVAEASCIPLMITHSPGKMLVTDSPHSRFKVA